MPQIKFSGLVTAMKGKAGGSIFSQNKQGAYFRNNRWGGGRKSQRWDNAKTRLSLLSNQWRQLSDEQREAWSTAAINYPATNKFNEEYIPSGYQLFMSLNGNLYAHGFPLLSIPAEKRPFPEDFTIDVSTPNIPWVTPSSGVSVPLNGNGLIKPCSEDEECPFGFYCYGNGCKPNYALNSPEFLAERDKIRNAYVDFGSSECSSDQDCYDAGLGTGTDIECVDGVCVYVGDGLVAYESTGYVLNIADTLYGGGKWDESIPFQQARINGSFRFTLGTNSMRLLKTTQQELVLVSNYKCNGTGLSIRMAQIEDGIVRIYVTLGLITSDNISQYGTLVWRSDYDISAITANNVFQFQINPAKTQQGAFALNLESFRAPSQDNYSNVYTTPISEWGAPAGSQNNPYTSWNIDDNMWGIIYGTGPFIPSKDVTYADIRFYASKYNEVKYALSGMLQGSETILITANGQGKPKCNGFKCGGETLINVEVCAKKGCNCSMGQCTPYSWIRERLANQAPGGNANIHLVAAAPIMQPDPVGDGSYTFSFAGTWLNLQGAQFTNLGATYVPLTTASISPTQESGFQFVVSASYAKGDGKTVRITEFVNLTTLPTDVSADWELWDWLKPAITSAPPGTKFWIAFDIIDSGSGAVLKAKKRIRFKAGADLSSSVN